MAASKCDYWDHKQDKETFVSAIGAIRRREFYRLTEEAAARGASVAVVRTLSRAIRVGTMNQHDYCCRITSMITRLWRATLIPDSAPPTILVHHFVSWPVDENCPSADHHRIPISAAQLTEELVRNFGHGIARINCLNCAYPV